MALSVGWAVGRRADGWVRVHFHFHNLKSDHLLHVSDHAEEPEELRRASPLFLQNITALEACRVLRDANDACS